MPDHDLPYIVVGSGPAGIACAQGLLAAGKAVTLVDAGLQLETERQAAVDQLATSPLQEWTPQATAFLKEGFASGAAGIPLKLLYGSDFSYRQPRGATPVVCQGAESKPSYARGGLSTVWGSAVLPYRQADIEDWPISVQDLEEGYRAVLQWMPLSARHDNLAALFPLYTEHCEALPSSRQASGLFDDLQRHRARLAAHGVHFGWSRLAVRAAGDPACVRCGLCMYGCPHRLIWSSDQTLAELVARRQVTYLPGLTVQSVEEREDAAEIHAVDEQGQPRSLRARRVFLASGVLNTTTILLRSLGWYDRPVPIRDSQYFLLPLLRLRGTAGVMRESLHTLAQLFLEVQDPRISPYTIHLQTYTYNELFRDPVLAAAGPFQRFFPMETFLGRLLLFQGYLHSAHSAPIQASLERTDQGEHLTLHADAASSTRPLLRQLAGKFSRLARQTGVLPLLPLLQMGKPGRGFHSGGSFPMSAAPAEGKSDLLGRPFGSRFLHAVDATILPSIPATTITYTVMANAYRIGAASARLEDGL